MITIDNKKCRKCGVCIHRFMGYCINEENGYPVIDYSICNQCQKCIALCPHQAILMNGKSPFKIETPLEIRKEDIIDLLRRRRSIKKFKNEPIPKEVLSDLASAANYAPNQNKNIDMIIVDDKTLLNEIDASSIKYVKKMYRFLFSVKIMTGVFKLFSDSLDVIKRKMEYNIYGTKHVIKENTQALFILIGDTKVPVTESSAHYLLSTIIFYTEAYGIGSCLMDSIKHSINCTKSVRKLLHIPKGKKVLGVLSVGYSDEKIINIPQGYKINVRWNTEE